MFAGLLLIVSTFAATPSAEELQQIESRAALIRQLLDLKCTPTHDLKLTEFQTVYEDEATDTTPRAFVKEKKIKAFDVKSGKWLVHFVFNNGDFRQLEFQPVAARTEDDVRAAYSAVKVVLGPPDTVRKGTSPRILSMAFWTQRRGMFFVTFWLVNDQLKLVGTWGI